MGGMDFVNTKKTDCTQQVKGSAKSRVTTKEIEWLDYVALNKALERGRKHVAKLLLSNNCRVNILSDLDVPRNTPLHNAVLLRDIDLVDCLLSKGASVAAINCEGDTPLHLAFIQRQEELVDLILLFINKTCNFVNPKNRLGLTHLHIASTRKNIELVENFLKAGAAIQDSINVNSYLWSGYTAMHFAVEFKSLQVAQLLQKAISEPKKDNNNRTALQLAYQTVKDMSIMVHMLSAENHFLNFGYFTYPSYFHFACMRNDPKIVFDFIKNGADVNTPISRDATFCAMYSPLHFAVESHCLENVKLLLESGAIIEQRNYDNMTALHLAMYNENHNKQKYTIVDHLYTALEDKDKTCLQDNNGLSYLHIACTRNDVELVKKYLNNNHDVNAVIHHNHRKFSYYTPLHFAVLYQAFEVTQFLVERGAEVNADDPNESGTPLHLACELGHIGIIDLLLKNGANVKMIRTKGHKSSLHLLVENYMDRENRDLMESKMEMIFFIKRLVKLGVNVNARDHLNYTALHIACWKFVDGAECVKKLLEVGANINCENVDGQTPLEMVGFGRYCGNAENYMMLYHHVQKLKVLGFKVNCKNEGYCELILREKDNWDPEHKDFKDKKLVKKEEQRRDEIQKLKNVCLQNSELTLYDLLVYDVNSLMIFANDEVVKKIVDEKGLKKLYPVFAHFLKLRYEKAVRMQHAWDQKIVKATSKPIRKLKKKRLR